jgi:hypothetical protein
MRLRTLFATLSLIAAAGCSGGSGSSTPASGGGSSPNGAGTLVTGSSGFTFSSAFLGFVPSDPNYRVPTLIFGASGIAESTTVSAPKYSGTFTITPQASATCATPAKVFTTATTDHKTFTFTSGTTAGLCELTVSDTAGGSSTLWISVTLASGTAS